MHALKQDTQRNYMCVCVCVSSCLLALAIDIVMVVALQRCRTYYNTHVFSRGKDREINSSELNLTNSRRWMRIKIGKIGNTARKKKEAKERENIK